MKAHHDRYERDNIRSLIYILLAIALNVAPAYAARKVDLPIYLDTVGTFMVSALMGLFPGIFTAVVTNLLCCLFNPSAIYFSIINVSIAVYAAWYSVRRPYKSWLKAMPFALICGIFSGAVSASIQWTILMGPQSQAIADFVDTITILPEFLTFLILNILLNIFDKALTLGVAVFILNHISPKTRSVIKNFGWKQKALTDEEIRKIRKRDKGSGHSIGMRMSIILVGISMILVVIMGCICVRLYFKNLKEERTISAINAARFAASIIDPEKVTDYIRNGEEAEGYKETKDLLQAIKDNAMGITYLYAVKMEEDGCYFVFDLDTEDVPGYKPGEKVEVEEVFLPYMDRLLKGEEIEPVEHDDIWGWTLTVYYPVRDSRGRTVCYTGADVLLDYTAGYMHGFIRKVVLIMSGFFVLVIAFGLWITNTYTTYPIGSIISCVDGFAEEGDSQDKLDENVKKIRQLNIKTDDELERLYRAICDMTLDQAERMRQIRHYSETTAKMQDGLIITMADMVENRDSDTGAHIQKTAAYVRIIVEGLRKNGYYVEKITDKYISDVVRSAPLHDVGKINIPDEVLNKPGKLTDEEYEIMKTHAIAGKRIMEKAISTVHGENYLKEARNMAGYHHERWDGKGYPEGLHGEVIPLSARIMAVADVFDALTSPRVYKPAFPLEKALSIIREGAGNQFDPKCVEVFMESLDEVKVVLRKYNNQDV